MKRRLRAAAKAVILLALGACALWFALVLLLIHRAD